MAPRIDRKNLQQKKVRVGHFLKIEADVIGEPPPAISWTLKGKSVIQTDRFFSFSIVFIFNSIINTFLFICGYLIESLLKMKITKQLLY